jgi:serine protease inhibitor
MVGGVLALLVTGLRMALVWPCLLVGGSALLSFLLEAMRLSECHTRLLRWRAAMLCMAGLVYVAADSFVDRPVPFAPTPAVKTPVAGNTALALDLYQKFRTAPVNVFFSPFGISTGLGQVYAGACGSTESESGHAAHFRVAQADLHPGFGELIARMGRLQHGSRLALVTASALWRPQGHPF